MLGKNESSAGARRLRLGFACVWDLNPRRTWSYTPWDLREALRRRSDVDVIDIGFTVPRFLRRALQLAALRYRAGRWVTPWKQLRVWEMALEHELNRRAVALGCDVVLQIQDLGAISTPFLLYQDFSYDVVLECMNAGSMAAREYFPHLDVKTVMRLRGRQMRIYSRAAHMLTMSDFLKRSLIEKSGVEPNRITTVPPGVSTTDVSRSEQATTQRFLRSPRNRLLFVGTTFLVKGGDQVLAALALLRRYDETITLTVIGPATWPLATAIPQGVDFLGRIDPEALSRIYYDHDLLVVPSRLEGFGKVFVEALCHGLPCIGRRAFAMAELIEPGVNGDLVESEDPRELAERIERVLGNEGIYRACEKAQDSTRIRFSWDTAADAITAAAIASVTAKT